MSRKTAISLTRGLTLLNCGPVVLATTLNKEGKSNIITLAWVTPVSSKPPLLVFALSPKRYSYECLKGLGEFVINIPTAELLSEIHFCGIHSGRDIDKAEATGLTLIQSAMVKPSSLEECVAHLECRVVNAHVTGDHELFVGEVVAASINTDWFDNAQLPLGSFLHHLGGKCYARTGEIVEAQNE